MAPSRFVHAVAIVAAVCAALCAAPGAVAQATSGAGWLVETWALDASGSLASTINGIITTQDRRIAGSRRETVARRISFSDAAGAWTACPVSGACQVRGKGTPILPFDTIRGLSWAELGALARVAPQLGGGRDVARSGRPQPPARARAAPRRY
jgi:hypothetical protein